MYYEKARRVASTLNVVVVARNPRCTSASICECACAPLKRPNGLETARARRAAKTRNARDVNSRYFRHRKRGAECLDFRCSGRRRCDWSRRGQTRQIGYVKSSRALEYFGLINAHTNMIVIILVATLSDSMLQLECRRRRSHDGARANCDANDGARRTRKVQTQRALHVGAQVC